MSEIVKSGPFEGWTDIMPITETAEKKLRPCIFCGRMPETIYAVFSFPRREVCTQVVCRHKGCPIEYFETPMLWMFSVRRRQYSITEPFSGYAIGRGNTIQEAIENAREQIMNPANWERFLRALICKCGGTILNDIPMKDKSND